MLRHLPVDGQEKERKVRWYDRIDSLSMAGRVNISFRSRPVKENENGG